MFSGLIPSDELIVHLRRNEERRKSVHQNIEYCIRESKRIREAIEADPSAPNVLRLKRDLRASKNQLEALIRRLEGIMNDTGPRQTNSAVPVRNSDRMAPSQVTQQQREREARRSRFERYRDTRTRMRGPVDPDPVAPESLEWPEDVKRFDVPGLGGRTESELSRDFRAPVFAGGGLDYPFFPPLPPPPNDRGFWIRKVKNEWIERIQKDNAEAAQHLLSSGQTHLPNYSELMEMMLAVDKECIERGMPDGDTNFPCSSCLTAIYEPDDNMEGPMPLLTQCSSCGKLSHYNCISRYMHANRNQPGGGRRRCPDCNTDFKIASFGELPYKHQQIIALVNWMYREVANLDTAVFRQRRSRGTKRAAKRTTKRTTKRTRALSRKTATKRRSTKGGISRSTKTKR